MVIGLLIGIAICWTLFAVFRPWQALLASVFLVPWDGLYVDLGLTVSAYRISVFALTVGLAIRWVAMPNRVVLVNNFNSRFVGYYVYTVAVTAVLTPFAAAGYGWHGGDLRSPELRAATQVVMSFLALSPVFILPAIAKSSEDLRKIGRVFMISLATLACLGWLQLALWYGTGWNPFPIGVVHTLLGGDVGAEKEGLFGTGSEVVYRMNSLGGEPKNLAQNLAFGILVSVLMLVARGGRRRSNGVWILLFLLVSMLATFSTSGIFLTGIYMLVGIVVYRSAPGLSNMASGQAASYLLIIMVLAGAFTVFQAVYFDSGQQGLNVLEERTVDRANLEDFDAAVLRFLVNEPGNSLLGVGLGNVHLYATDYLDAYARAYAQGQIFVAKSGLLRIVSETGLVGLMLFLMATVFLLRRLRAMLAVPQLDGVARENGALLLALGAAVLVGILVRGGYVQSQFFVVMGCVSVFCREIIASRPMARPYGIGFRASTGP